MPNQTVSREELLARVRVNAYLYLRPDWYLRLMRVYESAAEILRQSPEDIAKDGGISTDTAANFLKEALALDAEAELEKVEKSGAAVLVQEDERYPSALREIPDPPLVIYVRGKADFSVAAAAIVGTRKPTAYGVRMAARLSRELSSCGLAVASGLARGIDSAAHDAVVRSKGVTWAVLGNGLGRCYPAENKKLAQAIVDCGGALVSEFPFDKHPLPFHFPRRNRIIAGLSRATVVVEGLKTSGALITAKFALEQGREVLAVPGPADSPQSEGPNKLLRDGAALAESGLDVINALPPQYLFGVAPDALSGEKSGPRDSDRSGLSEDGIAVLDCLASAQLPLEEVVERLEWSVPRAAGAIFELETKSRVICRDGMYSKK